MRNQTTSIAKKESKKAEKVYKAGKRPRGLYNFDRTSFVWRAQRRAKKTYNRAERPLGRPDEPKSKKRLHSQLEATDQVKAAGPTGVAGAPGESEVKEAGQAAPQSRASSGSQRGSFLVERAGRNK